MRSEFLQFAFYLIALVLGGAVEEFLPKVTGVGFPVLMALVACVAVRRPAVTMVLVALAAGAFEDALSSLPTMTSASFFLVVAVLVRKVGFAGLAVVAAYPAYQVWLRLIVPELAGSVGLRFLAAIPVAALTAPVVDFVLSRSERKAALDEA